jgi:hypothetical protein
MRGLASLKSMGLRVEFRDESNENAYEMVPLNSRNRLTRVTGFV